MLIKYVLLVTFAVYTYSEGCRELATEDGVVCVCDSTYCDTVPDLDVSSGNYQIFSTSAKVPGFNSRVGSFGDDDKEDIITIEIDPNTKYQTIFGFGGAFTDATGINIYSLPLEAQENLLESYFSESGIQYSFCRVPVGGTDFSTRGYSYDDEEEDITLEHFNLAEDDLKYKIPYIQKAQELTNHELNLFSSVWTAPKWMKSNNDWAGPGWLKDEYYQLWADYLLRFFDEYEKHNITFWGMTPQNEPINGFAPTSMTKVNAMGWLPVTMNKWIGENLGPSIRNSSHKNVKIIVHDDNRALFFILFELLSNPITLSYADGVAFHWYTDIVPISITSAEKIKAYKEDLFVISSEACNGFLTKYGQKPVAKGSWERGHLYALDIINNLEGGSSAWVDWNMALDESGGPTYVENFVDSPIIVNSDLQEFYKQPMFYVMGHFSKFIRPGSIRLGATVTGAEDTDKFKAVAFLRPDNLTALVVYNSGASNVTIKVEQGDGKAVIDIESKSLNTILFTSKNQQY